MKLRKLAMPNIEQAYTVEKTEDGFMQFKLIEDGTFTILPFEFYDAFQLLFSEEFAEFIRCINKRNEYEIEYRESFNDACKRGDTVNSKTLYEITNSAKTYGVWDGKCIQMRDAIIDNVSWNTWIDTCRLYEVFTGTPREWVS